MQYKVAFKMELPSSNVEPMREKIEELKEGSLFHCDLFDAEIVHKIAAALLPGLATACIDNTTGDLFKSPALVASDIRKEMVHYLTERSEAFVAESVILATNPDEAVSDHPYDIISDFIDDFASSKTTLFSRVSGWLLSESREDKIDDFVQEMDINRFWMIDGRDAVAQTLLKNVDIRNNFHCNMRFNSTLELSEHGSNCRFRSLNCPNEGCNSTIPAGQIKKHDLSCPFKILPCEQKCSDYIMRREMDKHCITVCPMRLVNCPFYSMGCQCTIPHSMAQQHCLENLHSHLLCILKVVHGEGSVTLLEQQVKQLELLSSPGQLEKLQDVRSLTYAVKDLEAKLGSLEVNAATKLSEEATESLTFTVKDLEAKLEPLEVNATTNLNAEATKSVTSAVKDHEAKVEPLEVNNAVNFSEETTESVTPAIKDHEAKLEPLEINANLGEEITEYVSSAKDLKAKQERTASTNLSEETGEILKTIAQVPEQLKI